MTNSRGWLLRTALACFAAGLAVGLAIPVAVAAFATPETQGDERYVEQMAKTYQLRPGQVRLLRAIMAEKTARDQDLWRTFADKLPPEMRSQRKTISDWVDMMVQGLLEPGGQRERFLADSQPKPNDR